MVLSPNAPADSPAATTSSLTSAGPGASASNVSSTVREPPAGTTPTKQVERAVVPLEQERMARLALVSTLISTHSVSA